MAEHCKVYEVTVKGKIYYVGASAGHKLLGDLDNLRVQYVRVRITKRKFEIQGSSIWFKGTLEQPLKGVPELRAKLRTVNAA